MPPKKEAKTNGRTLNDFLDVLTELSNLYEKQGDERRAKSFATTKENLAKCDETAVLEWSGVEWRRLFWSKDYKNIKGVGKSTLELMDEFIKTGTCARLEELRGAGEQVALIRGEASLELGVFKDDNGDENYLFLYELGDDLKRALYKDADRYYCELIRERQREERNNYDGDGGIDDVRERMVESFAGFERLTDDYADDWSKFHHFVRKANANDLKRKDWEGDADVNWKKPNGITREGLRDLLRAGNYEKRYEEAYKQLIEEEKSFLEEAKTNLRTALEDFPYEDVTFDGGFNLLVEDTFLDFYGYKMYCKQCEESKEGGCVKAYVTVYYELHLCGKKCYIGLGSYSDYHWSEEDLAFHFTDFDEEHREELSWGESFDEEDWSFCGNVAECVGKELVGIEDGALETAIDELYEKHEYLDRRY